MSDTQITEREVKTLTTPSGKEVEVKTYMNARERNQIRSVFLSGMKYDISDLKNGANGIGGNLSGSLFDQSAEKLIEVMIVKFDGSDENILNRLLDCSPEDYDFVVNELDEMIKGPLGMAK